MTEDEKIIELTKRLIDEGKVIEAGWVGLRSGWLPPDTPQHILDEMRNAFFAGSMHLYSCIMSTLDEGDEGTPDDMKRLDNIADELAKFQRSYFNNIETKGSA